LAIAPASSSSPANRVVKVSIHRTSLTEAKHTHTHTNLIESNW